jgi:hypothetical protein
MVRVFVAWVQELHSLSRIDYKVGIAFVLEVFESRD